MSETKQSTDTKLPGEEAPLEMRYGGEPIRDEEALGVARRLARVHAAHGRTLTAMKAPDELPPHDAPRVQAAFRIPPRLLMRVRARADMESVTVSDVVVEALEAYANGVPGSKVKYVAPKTR